MENLAKYSLLVVLAPNGGGDLNNKYQIINKKGGRICILNLLFII